MNLKFRRHFNPSLTALVLTLIVLFLLIISLLYNYITTKNTLGSLTYSRHQALTHLSATVVKDRLDLLTDLGVSFATRVQFRRNITEGDWQSAINVLQSIPKDFNYIDRIFLADINGVLMADTPTAEGIRGTDFSFRDWYQGVTKNWQPYVSSAYIRQAKPQREVIAIAIPIISETNTKLGILVLQVRLDTFLEWANNIGIQNASVSIIDHSGQIINKTYNQISFKSQRDHPLVNKILSGKSGLEISSDPISGQPSLIASEIIPEYGWGVIISEPTITAFSDQSRTLNNLLVFSSLILLISLFFVILLYETFSKIDQEHQQINLLFNHIGDGVIAIDSNWIITRFNPAAESISGFSRDEVVGKPLQKALKFLRETDHQEDYSFIEDAMLTKTTKHIEVPTVLVHKEGHDLPIGDSTAPIINGMNNVVGAIIVIRDLTHEPAVHRLHSEKPQKTAK